MLIYLEISTGDLFVCLFIISATNKRRLFVINDTTGVISLNGTLDRETVSDYKLQVLVIFFAMGFHLQ